MICKVCGNQIPKEYLTMDRFSCPSCGKVYHKKTTQQPSVEPTKYGSHQTENQDVSDNRIPESTKRLSLKKYLFIVIILLILLIVIVVVNGRNTKSIIVSNPSTIDGEWYYSGYVDFYNLFCDGVFSSEEDWKTSISERLIDPQPGNTNDRIKIIDGTIVDRNGYSGTVSVSPISSSEYEYYYDYDGKRIGGSIARVGQELHLYDNGELYIYSLAGTTPQWLFNSGNIDFSSQLCSVIRFALENEFLPTYPDLQIEVTSSSDNSIWIGFSYHLKEQDLANYNVPSASEVYSGVHDSILVKIRKIASKTVTGDIDIQIFLYPYGVTYQDNDPLYVVDYPSRANINDKLVPISDSYHPCVYMILNGCRMVAEGNYWINEQYIENNSGNEVTTNITPEPTQTVPQIKSYQETSKKDNENLKYTLIFISIVAIGIALFVYIRGRLTKCPECGKKFAMIEISRKTVDSRSTTMDIERQVKDSKGNVIRTYLEAVPATKFYYDCVDECKYCGYRRRVSREATYRD